MTQHVLEGLSTKNLPLYVFKLREVGVRNEKIITAKIITAPKSKKREKSKC